MGRRRLTREGLWLAIAACYMPLGFQMHEILRGASWLEDRMAFLIGMGALGLMLRAANAAPWLLWSLGGFLVLGAIGAQAELTPVYRFCAGLAQLVIVASWCELANYWSLSRNGTPEREITRVAAGIALAGMAWFIVVNVAPSPPWSMAMRSVGERVTGSNTIEMALSIALWASVAWILVRTRWR